LVDSHGTYLECAVVLEQAVSILSGKGTVLNIAGEDLKLLKDRSLILRTASDVYPLEGGIVGEGGILLYLRVRKNAQGMCGGKKLT
jgi:hypothetical protein